MALIAHYPLNGDTKDYSGYGNDINNFGATESDDGKIGSCYRFLGETQYAEVDILNPVNEFASFSVWFNTEDVLLSQSILSQRGVGNHVRGIILGRNQVEFWTRNSSSVWTTIASPITANKWINVVGVQDNNYIYLYVDGELKNSRNIVEPNKNFSGYVTIGKYTDADFFMKGTLNDIRIYDHALSDKEVKEIAKAKVLHYKFDEHDLTTQIVKDSSGFRNDGTVAVATAPSWSEDSPVGRGSMEFSGAKFITLPNMLGSDEQITACAWFKTNGLGGSGYHIIFGGTKVELDVTSAGNARFGLIVNNVRQVHNHSSGLADGKYHHICGVFDGAVKSIYVDGVLVGSNAAVGKIKNNFTNRRVGVFGTQTNYHANGNIADVRIYATALSPEDILELYQTRASLDNEGNLFVQEIDEMSPTLKSIDSRGIASYMEFNEVDGDNKMSIGDDGVVYVNEIMEA